MDATDPHRGTTPENALIPGSSLPCKSPHFLLTLAPVELLLSAPPTPCGLPSSLAQFPHSILYMGLCVPRKKGCRVIFNLIHLVFHFTLPPQLQVSLVFVFSLRYNQHIIIYSFHVHSIVVRYTCILKNDHHSNPAITMHGSHFFSFMRTYKIYSLNNFQLYSTVLLTTGTTLYFTSPGLVYLIRGSWYP